MGISSFGKQAQGGRRIGTTRQAHTFKDVFGGGYLFFVNSACFDFMERDYDAIYLFIYK